MRKELVFTALCATILTLIVLAPIGYVFMRNMPQPIATVDLQKLVEEAQQNTIDVLGKDKLGTAEATAAAEKLTADFAKKLSTQTEALGVECNCIIVNKAALLTSASVDYTDLMRERLAMKK